MPRRNRVTLKHKIERVATQREMEQNLKGVNEPNVVGSSTYGCNSDAAAPDAAQDSSTSSTKSPTDNKLTEPDKFIESKKHNKKMLREWQTAECGKFETCIADVNRWLCFLGQNIRSRLTLKRLEREYDDYCDNHKPNNNMVDDTLAQMEDYISSFQIRHYRRFAQLDDVQCMTLQRQLQRLRALYGCLTGIAYAAIVATSAAAQTRHQNDCQKDSQKRDDDCHKRDNDCQKDSLNCQKDSQSLDMNEINDAFCQVLEQIQNMYMILFLPASPPLVRESKASSASGSSSGQNTPATDCDVKRQFIVNNGTNAAGGVSVQIGLATKCGLWSTNGVSFETMLASTSPVLSSKAHRHHRHNDDRDGNDNGDKNCVDNDNDDNDHKAPRVIARADSNGTWINPFAELKCETLQQFLNDNTLDCVSLNADGSIAFDVETSLQYQLKMTTLNALHAYYIHNGYDSPHPDEWYDEALWVGCLFCTPSEVQRVQTALYHWLR